MLDVSELTVWPLSQIPPMRGSVFDRAESTALHARHRLKYYRHRHASTAPKDILCDLWNIQTEYMFDTSQPLTTKDLFRAHCMYPEPCEACDTTPVENSMPLCKSCEHFHPQHFISCRYGKLVPRAQFNRPSELTDRDVAIVMGPFREASNSCHFCRFVISGLKSHFENDYVVALAGTDVSYSLRMDRKSISVEDGDHGFNIYAGRPGNQLLFWPYIEWSLLNTWLAVVDNTSPSKSFSFSQELRDVIVIDVINLNVVRLPPQAKYLALCYIWGVTTRPTLRAERSNISGLARQGSLENTALPSTVSDAMTVCRNLHEQFLWVDQLCIIQDDEHVQLDQMAAIYNPAALTLVALAGGDASHGLPGVSYPRALRQARAVLKNDVQLVIAY
jgi:hypothetical protein